MNALLNLLNGDFVVKLLVATAALVFGVQLFSMIPVFAEHVGDKPGIAIINLLFGLVGALFNPAILLGIAKLITLKKG